jgi:ubiquinone/menaquinone biosynthesis C-methylase UbiE
MGYHKCAKYYDLIYHDKDYAKECDFLESIFTEFSKKPNSILDIGCGTGGHAIHLAKRGYEVSGIDISKEMIEVAKSKIKQKNVKTEFLVSSMQEFNLNKKFDVCISMFSSINYLLSYNDVKKTFTNIRYHLKEEGLFIFDCWNAIAVTQSYLPVKIKAFEDEKYKIIRISETKVNKLKQLCEIKWTYIVIQKDIIKDYFSEILKLRIFFLEELRYLLDSCGFRVLKICPFMKTDKEIQEDTWDITIISRVKK